MVTHPQLLRLCVCVDRNLSSVNQRTRQKMRDLQGLVESLVSYIQQEDKADDKVTHCNNLRQFYTL